MTDLIYRGVPHSGYSSTQQRTAPDLIYRGVRHDGISRSKGVAGYAMTLRYRGSPHTAFGAAPVALDIGANLVPSEPQPEIA